MSTVVFGRKSGTGTFHRFAKSGLAVCIIAGALAAPARAGTNVAVIEEVVGEGTFWCPFLTANGYPCTIFPPSGPTAPLDSFQVVIDLSKTWTDPTGSLADFMQTGKAVITRGGVPWALGIETNAVVQAWVGGTFTTLGGGLCRTTTTDEILGSIPVGTPIDDCGDSGCSGLGGESGFPNVKVLARWESGTTSVGLMRNTWETGRSVYLPYSFRPEGAQNQEILLRTMSVLSPPIPTISAAGLIVTAILVLILGSLIVRRQHQVLGGKARSTTPTLILVVFCVVAAIVTNPASAEVADEIRLQVGPQSTEMYLNDSAEPFHVTTRAVLNTRIEGVPGSQLLLLIWDEVRTDLTLVPYNGISPDGQNVVRVTEASHVLPLRYSRFDPLVNGANVPQVLQADVSDEMYIIQLWSQPLSEFNTALANLGVCAKGYLPTQSVIASVPPAIRDQVASLPFVRWIGPFHPAYRMEEQVLVEITNGANVEVRNYSIMLWERGAAAQQMIAERIAQLGGCVRRYAPEQNRLVATLTLDQVKLLANDSQVEFIDIPGEVGFDVDMARDVSGANFVEAAPGPFKGQGVCGEVMDTWLRTAPLHEDFQSRGALLHGANDGALDDHGTKVFGLIFGDGSCQSNARGILPGAQGIFARHAPAIEDEPPQGDCGTPQQGARYTEAAELVNPAGPYYGVFQSNSWGHVHKPNYTTISAELDDIAFSLDLTVCTSQGNFSHHTPSQQGVPRPEASAKNVISVGGLRHKDNATHSDDDWCADFYGCDDFSICARRGPASDGRVKPDLVHFADCAVRTTSDLFTTCNPPPCPTCYVEDFNGTSAATPITCGYGGLAFQMWHESVFNVWNGTISVPTGTPTGTVFSDRPHATTVKAMLINTAYRYPLVTEPPLYRPDFTRDNMGWGIVDVAALYEQRNNMFIVNETDLLSNLGTRSYTYTVPTGSPALRVTMVYSDPPATACSTIHLVNDLSVKVVSPNGAVYWGNYGLITCQWSCPTGYFVGNWSVIAPNPAFPKKDHVNNVENVFIKNPQPGNWTITVIADAIIPGQDGHVETPEFDADYALVVSSGDRPRGRCCQTVCEPPYSYTCSWTSRAACTGPLAFWTSDATCADGCDDTGACCLSSDPNDCVMTPTSACCDALNGVFWYGLTSKCETTDCSEGPLGPQPGDPDP